MAEDKKVQDERDKNVDEQLATLRARVDKLAAHEHDPVDVAGDFDRKFGAIPDDKSLAVCANCGSVTATRPEQAHSIELFPCPVCRHYNTARVMDDDEQAEARAKLMGGEPEDYMPAQSSPRRRTRMGVAESPNESVETRNARANTYGRGGFNG